MSDFVRALKIVLQHEGGWYPGGPGDPNPTMYGITQATYDSWRTKRQLPLQTVRNIKDEELQAIYRDRYWIPAGCEPLSWPLNLLQFDAAVNHGVKRAQAFLLQTEDPVTYLGLRESFYRRLVTRRPETGRFLKGWLNRLASLREHLT